MNDVRINRIVSQRIKSREIVKEIFNFGVTEAQKVQIIYLLSLELENRDLMVEISTVTKLNKDKQNTNNKKLLST